MNESMVSLNHGFYEKVRVEVMLRGSWNSQVQYLLAEWTYRAVNHWSVVVLL